MPLSSLGRRFWPLLAASLIAVSGAAGDETSGPAAMRASAARVEAQLERAGRADLIERWQRGVRLEQMARRLERDQPERAVEGYREATALFAGIVEEQPALAAVWWRCARAAWAVGDTLPLDAKAERLALFEEAEAYASRGLEADPDCAECMLWKFSAMGRTRTTRGVWTAIRGLRPMAALLDRGIALQPTYSDDEGNSTLGNLHYSSAIFYRILPEWFWLGWVLGVRGDKDRALAHIERALELHPARLDYQVELGAQLLCLGSARDDRRRRQAGTEVLHAAVLREAKTQDDARELAAARVMLEQPRKACGYSGDTWVEVDRAEATRAAAQVGADP